MALGRCDECGKRFTNKHNYELHKELRNCGSESDSADTSSTDHSREIQGGDTVRNVDGTVSHYDDDGGFGFVTTVDLQGKLVEDAAQTQGVFFHISDLHSNWVDEGDRLRFDVREDDRGLRCENVEILVRDRDRDSYEKPVEKHSGSGFGDQKDDTQYGAGRKPSATESDIESFKDERKFR